MAQSRKRFPARTNFKISRAVKTASASGLAQTFREMADGSWELGSGFAQFFSSQASSEFFAKRPLDESRLRISILILQSGRFSIRRRHCWRVLPTDDQIESQEVSDASSDRKSVV